MKKVFILANPSSGKKEAEKYAKQVEEQYKEQNWQTTLQFTQEKADIKRFTKIACKEKYDTLIALGGDGTISELINALKGEKNKPKVGIIPTGTVNNVAQGLGIATDLEQAVKQLSDSTEQVSDVGEINDRLFISSVSAGTIPETAWEVSAEEKEKLGPLAYFVEGLKSLNKQEDYSVELKFDDQEPIELDLTLLIIGVSSSILGIDSFFEDARYNDGKLHLFCLKQGKLSEKFMTFSRVLTNNEITNNDDIAFATTFREVTIRLKKDDLHVALDGEKGPSFPLTIKVIPDFVTFLLANN